MLEIFWIRNRLVIQIDDISAPRLPFLLGAYKEMSSILDDQ